MPISIIYFILFAASVGIIYLIKKRISKHPRKLQLLAIQDQVREANLNFKRSTNFEKYFANWDEHLFLNTYYETRKAIRSRFEKLDLPEEYIIELKTFINNFDNSSSLREQYNDEFVIKESEKYSAFFKNLENYPLSADQVEAIIRDEDNNLVIAGAGTGKTTTISGKVAYILEKKLALPEELLVISFTKNAVIEMYDRCMRFCQHIPAAKKLEVRTFNSYGFLVCRSCSPREILLAFDGDDTEAKVFLQEQFDELFINDANFHRKAVNFLAFFNRPPRDEFAFESQDDYMIHEESFKNITLDGIKVQSKEEMEIGNFFCLFGVNYEYQRHFPLNEEDRNADYGAYRPDFYLPDYEIWHEHFGIDRNGDVPKWFRKRPPFETASDYYHAGINWKEQIHTKYKTRLIKTYSYENQEGKLLTNLKENLIKEGVILRERNPEELLELMKGSEQYTDFMDLIYTFLGLMKSNGKTPDMILPKGDKRLHVFLDVFNPLFTAYERHLDRLSSIDYSDMINHAAQHFSAGKYTKPYKYILVDEFQDMSLGRYNLLKAIRLQNPGVKLYAVGDDWQSIFRFTGSDISIITQFERQFGFTSQTAVLKTYRFNSQILNTSSTFIQKNPFQLQKKLAAHHPTPGGHISFEFVKMPSTNGGREQYAKAKSHLVVNILKEILLLQDKVAVFLIGRYKFNAPIGLKAISKQFPTLTLHYYTAHAVKGMTCDYAILLDVDSGTLGFPSGIADDPLLNHLLHEGEAFENAEERRVFYVAITRARYKNYLIYNENKPSKFLLELQTDIASQITLKS
ncbi:UvrD-helicase domain-containing protein [Mucilaginibacter sp. AW1-3]